MSASRPLRAVIVVASVLIVVGVVLVLSQSSRHVTGTNLVNPEAFVAFVPGGGQVCQGIERLPADTGVIAMTVGTFGRPGPPLVVRLFSHGRVVARGGLPAGFQEGKVTVPIVGVDGHERTGTLCVVDGGRSRIAVAGRPGAGSPGAKVDGKPLAALVSFVYRDRASESWWPRLGGIFDRFGSAKAFGSWSLILAIVLFLVAVGVALGLLWRGGGSGREEAS